MSDILAYFYNVILNVVALLFDLEFVEGVTYGWFIMACIIVSVVVSFFFTRIIKR